MSRKPDFQFRLFEVRFSKNDLNRRRGHPRLHLRQRYLQHTSSRRKLPYAQSSTRCLLLPVLRSCVLDGRGRVQKCYVCCCFYWSVSSCLWLRLQPDWSGRFFEKSSVFFGAFVSGWGPTWLRGQGESAYVFGRRLSTAQVWYNSSNVLFEEFSSKLKGSLLNLLRIKIICLSCCWLWWAIPSNFITFGTLRNKLRIFGILSCTSFVDWKWCLVVTNKTLKKLELVT